MRVLIVSKAFVVGAYRQKLAEMARQGLDVVAVAPPGWREAGGRVEVEGAPAQGYTLVVSRIRFNGHFHLHYYPELAALIRAHRPDLVHIDEEPYNLATAHAVRAARTARMPSIFFSWQNIEKRFPPPFAQLERWVFGRVAGAIAGTSDVEAVLRAKGFRGPLAVIPQFGVDTDAFQPAGAPPARRFTVGLPNRLIEAKAPLQAIDAFSRLPADTCMKIVGDGPLWNEVHRRVLSLDLENRVEINRRLSSDRMPDFYRGVDAVVLPSRTTRGWKEQFGRVLIEAMASGTSVVASDSGEIPRVLGNAGLIVPEDDPDALADALRRLYSDGDLRAELGRRGRERAVSMYSHGSIAQATVNFYRRVLDDGAC